MSYEDERFRDPYFDRREEVLVRDGLGVGAGDVDGGDLVAGSVEDVYAAAWVAGYVCGCLAGC